jgi:glycosyltransferase involved in cell wall biosynthesis
METPSISVIIPTYNRCQMLGEALDSLLCQATGGEFSYDILVVDNASTDATRSVVEQVAARASMPVRYVYHDVPGDAPSRNRGIAETLAFFDDDQLAVPDWLRQLYGVARQTGAAIIAGAVRLDLPADTLRRFGPYVRGTSFRETEENSTVHLLTGKRLPGCANVLIARRVFESLGTFDASMAWGGSDTEFFLRSRAAGEAIYYAPGAVILHRIALNRLTPEYFRWDGQQGADTSACLDCKFKGRFRLVLLCLARIAQSLLVLLPGLAWARLTNDEAQVLDGKVRLWRNMGYVRRTLKLLAPRCFPQRQYFDYLMFRKGRTIGQQAAQVEAAS